MPHFPWEQYGITGAVVGVLFFILWRMLVWVMKWVDKQNDQHNAERVAWQKILEGLNQSIQLHNQGSVEARKATDEAHKYQREEHKEMIVLLGKMNGK
jgi:hypothetical protein